jgi:transposase-like protein
MSKDNVVELSSRVESCDPINELLRAGARSLIESAIAEELNTFLEQFSNRQLPNGRQAVVRNGYHPAREIQTGIGPVEVKVPKVRSRDGQAVTFNSNIVPPYVRKTRSLEAAIPWLYLRGISTGDMSAALEVLLGDKAKGFSAATVSRLAKQWESEYGQWLNNDLSNERWVYIWADGIHSRIRSDDDRLCALVVIGVNDRGKKCLLTIEDGYRESTQSWKELLLKLKARGMNDPKLAIGDGAMGFWAAMNEVYGSTQHQRCWTHKIVNVLNKLPKKAQPKATDRLREIYRAETREDAETAFELFLDSYNAKYPKAAECLAKDREELLAFFDYPAMHWQSIRTANPIESAFATIRHRTKRSKGCHSRKTLMAMMFKLGQCAEKKWRRLRGFESLGKVITGVKFKDGAEVDQDEIQAA